MDVLQLSVWATLLTVSSLFTGVVRKNLVGIDKGSKIIGLVGSHNLADATVFEGLGRLIAPSFPQAFERVSFPAVARREILTMHGIVSGGSPALYVSISRASHQATLFTDDVAKLGPQLGAAVSNETLGRPMSLS
jgi:hypothetical protein